MFNSIKDNTTVACCLNPSPKMYTYLQVVNIVFLIQNNARSDKVTANIHRTTTVYFALRAVTIYRYRNGKQRAKNLSQVIAVIVKHAMLLTTTCIWKIAQHIANAKSVICNPFIVIRIPVNTSVIASCMVLVRI